MTDRAQRLAHIRSRLAAEDRTSIEVSDYADELLAMVDTLTDHVTDLNERNEAHVCQEHELQDRIHRAAMTRVWTNEDGKKFVFVEDIAPRLLGLPTDRERAADQVLDQRIAAALEQKPTA